MPYLTDPDNLASLFGDDAKSYRTDQLRSWLYTSPVLTTAEMGNLPQEWREDHQNDLWPFAVEADLTADKGTTKKWLFRTPDGSAIEAVLMGY